MKLSARNQFKGTVIAIDEGAVNGIVKIDIGGGNVMSATISMAAIRELGLAVGKEAYAVVKASARFFSSVQPSLPSSTSTFIVPPQTMPSDSATSPVRSMSMI